MTSFPDKFAGDIRVLTPADDLGPVGSQAVVQLAQRGFVAVSGLTELHAGALPAFAKQPHIEEFCPNDGSRFGTLEKTEAWLKKGRGMVLLGDVKGYEGPIDIADLPYITAEDFNPMAYGWAGEEKNKHIDGADITTAYRVSEAGRVPKNGEKPRLGLPLGQLVVATAIHEHGANPEDISLETWLSNDVARHIYDRLGFVERAQAVDLEMRPTLQPVGVLVDGKWKGTTINGRPVFRGHLDENTVSNVVNDRRTYWQFDPSALQEAA